MSRPAIRSPFAPGFKPSALSHPITARRAFVVGGLATLAGVLPRRSQAASANPSDGVTPDQSNPTFWTQPRVVAVRNANTGQKGEFVYWRDGQYVMEEYYALSALSLDHREQKAVQIEPRVFDLMFATQAWYYGAKGKRTLHVLTSGYRTPATNQRVGGAPSSQHLKGRAADGRLEGVSLTVYASMLMAFRAGGVGLYTRHVHWDVGRAPAFWRSGPIEN